MEEKERKLKKIITDKVYIVKKPYTVTLQKFQALYGGTPEDFLVDFVALLLKAFARENHREMTDFCFSK